MMPVAVRNDRNLGYPRYGSAAFTHRLLSASSAAIMRPTSSRTPTLIAVLRRSTLLVPSRRRAPGKFSSAPRWTPFRIKSRLKATFLNKARSDRRDLRLAVPQRVRARVDGVVNQDE